MYLDSLWNSLSKKKREALVEGQELDSFISNELPEGFEFFDQNDEEEKKEEEKKEEDKKEEDKKEEDKKEEAEEGKDANPPTDQNKQEVILDI